MLRSHLFGSSKKEGIVLMKNEESHSNKGTRILGCFTFNALVRHIVLSSKIVSCFDIGEVPRSPGEIGTCSVFCHSFSLSNNVQTKASIGFYLSFKCLAVQLNISAQCFKSKLNWVQIGGSSSVLLVSSLIFLLNTQLSLHTILCV